VGVTGPIRPRRRRRAAAKRAIDVAGSAAGLVVAAVPMGVVAVALRRSMGRPVLFRQVRPGLHAEPFELVKFRTMRDGDAPDAERITPLGRFLRSTSLDELPELWNVLRGDMSLVGPRPLLVAYLDRYSPRQARRHEVRPGLTGLAQVSGRNLTTWEQRLEMDVAYVDGWTLGGDLRIIARTVLAVVRRHGIAAEGEATMTEFLGGPDPATDLQAGAR
jgi:lipopolysaccharide/colanic/teichoic acid biosynthesis glycosyltransferase